MHYNTKSIYIVLLLSAITITSKAQSLEEGQSMLSVGYGVISYRPVLYADIVKRNSTIPGQIQSSLKGPLYLRYEFMLDDEVSVGGNFAVVDYRISNSYKTNYNGNDTSFTDSYSFFSYSVLGRINYHLAAEDAFDVYFGFACGYRYVKSIYTDGSAGTSTDPDVVHLPLGLEVVLGARMLFTEHFGIYTELGIAKSIFQFGASYKF